MIRLRLTWCWFSVGGESPNLYYTTFPLYPCKTVLVVSNSRQLSKPAPYWFPYNQTELRRLCDLLGQMIMIPETVCREAPKQTSSPKKFHGALTRLGNNFVPVISAGSFWLVFACDSHEVFVSRLQVGIYHMLFPTADITERIISKWLTGIKLHCIINHLQELENIRNQRKIHAFTICNKAQFVIPTK